MEYKTLRDLGDINNTEVLVRLDLNVPIKDGEVADDYRIRKSLPTITFLKQKGAKIVIISHIEGEEATSLKPVYMRLQKNIELKFCERALEDAPEMIKEMKAGDILLCENIRNYAGEKKNDTEFAQQLSKFGKIFVNDAFSVSHREHASIVGVPKYLPSYAGLQFEEEVKNLSQLFDPEHPFLFILGGAKFDTKLPLVEKFRTIADTIFIGGALSNDVLKAKGMSIGDSLVTKTNIDLSGIAKDTSIVVPFDVVVKNSTGEIISKEVDEIIDGDKIMDTGKETLSNLRDLISGAKTILWNGPLGAYENGFKQPTLDLAEMISESGALSVVGGGDTLAAIAELDIEDKFGFVSTGGGAMLDFLANETLPGLEALK